MKKPVAKLLTSFIVLSLATAAVADELKMKNGDRLSGTVISMQGDTLMFATPYGREAIAINWSEVDCLSMDKQLPITMDGENFNLGTISCPQSGTAQVASAGLADNPIIPLAQLKAINPVNYTGQVSVGGSQHSGNTKASAVAASAFFKAKKKQHQLTLDGRYNYGEDDGSMSVNNYAGSMKYDYFFSKKMYGYLQTLGEHDRFADLDLRLTAGSGLGYQIFDTDRFRLSAEAGPSYMYEDFRNDRDRDSAAGRWAVGMDWDIFPGRLSFFHRHEGYYNFDAKAAILRSDQGFQIPLFSNLHANLESNYRFNSKPADDTKKSDLSLILGLSYKFSHW